MLQKDENGRLWDVRQDGKRYTPHFGEEMMNEAGEMLPFATGAARLMATGLANVTEKVRNKILTDEERQAIEQKQAQRTETDLGNGTANNFSGYLKQMKRGNENLGAIGKSLFKKAANAIKDKKKAEREDAKKIMKKKISIVVLLLAAVMLTACGTKEDWDADRNNSVEVVSATDPVSTPEVSEPVSTPKPAAPVLTVVTDKVDKIVGGDIPVGNVAEKVELPELHMYVTGELKEQVSSGTTGYETHYDEILLMISASYFQDPDPCWATYMVPHYETADYGRYIVDIDYQENISFGSTNITIFDSQMEAGIEMAVYLGIVNETAPTDEQRIYIKQYALMNAEYIKEQVSQWLQDFVPESGTEVSATAPVETVVEEKVYALDVYPDITVTLSYSDYGTVEILCQSPSDATIRQKLVKTEDGKLQALDEDGEMFMEITVSDVKSFWTRLSWNTLTSSGITP